MHFHLPKPLHGWREFAGEVGIIVLGVLIALAAEQIVEHWSWHRKANDTEAAIRRELAVNAGVFDERTIFAPCLARKEQQLTEIFRSAQQRHRLPSIANISGPADRPLETATWEAATANGTVSHLPDDFRTSVAELYQLIVDYRRISADENQLWSPVRLAAGSPGPISDALLAEMSVSLARARQAARSNDAAAEQSLEIIAKLGVTPNYSQVDQVNRADLLKALQCKQMVVDGKPLPQR